jgi:hypothetical protein
MALMKSPLVASFSFDDHQWKGAEGVLVVEMDETLLAVLC